MIADKIILKTIQNLIDRNMGEKITLDSVRDWSRTVNVVET